MKGPRNSREKRVELGGVGPGRALGALEGRQQAVPVVGQRNDRHAGRRCLDAVHVGQGDLDGHVARAAAGGEQDRDKEDGWSEHASKLSPSR